MKKKKLAVRRTVYPEFTTRFVSGNPSEINKFYLAIEKMPGGIHPKRRILFWDGEIWTDPTVALVKYTCEVYAYCELIPIPAYLK
ncbi:MAG: hypothetical protein HC773_01340 [Scytonema sp. CRU_2_7]|nr:hypothetical protein [Scytonema sp. CRU_2_7]